jgi:hypothetical protein
MAPGLASSYSKIGISVEIPFTRSKPMRLRRDAESDSAAATSPEIAHATPWALAASSIRAAMLIVLP